jgi:cation diffusion facilitator family transporter
MVASAQNIRIQKLVLAVGITLFVLKMTAWYLTRSMAILTDALESTINVVSGMVGLYSLLLSARPKDSNHPYGHGKVEFISAAIEGTLIAVAGLYIIVDSSLHLHNPHKITQLDTGLILIGISAIINFGVGFYSVKTGKKNQSLALIASGKHLMSDTYSSLGIMIGLLVLWVTELPWIDSAVAMLSALYIIVTGYKIIRRSLAGIMDEADSELLGSLVETLNKSRNTNWVDLHNLRIIKYGSILHLDCHLTVPWYLNVYDAHKEMDDLEKLVRKNYGESVELFVHIDGCMDFSCKICMVENCSVRKSPFERQVHWNVMNISTNSRHHLL